MLFDLNGDVDDAEVKLAIKEGAFGFIYVSLSSELFISTVLDLES